MSTSSVDYGAWLFDFAGVDFPWRRVTISELIFERRYYLIIQTKLAN
jgi:hypothetical protein